MKYVLYVVFITFIVAVVKIYKARTGKKDKKGNIIKDENGNIMGISTWQELRVWLYVLGGAFLGLIISNILIGLGL